MLHDYEDLVTSGIFRPRSHTDEFQQAATAAAALFGSCNACWPISSNFSARGAPKFREICNFFEATFAEDLRDLGASLGFFCISTH